MYTLIGSAKLNGLDPELYLRHVLARIADHPVSSFHKIRLIGASRPVMAFSARRWPVSKIGGIQRILPMGPSV
jgi:hypothetical protein